MHIYGARDRAINITIDGIDSNESSAGTATFSPGRANPDSLQENSSSHRMPIRPSGAIVARRSPHHRGGTNEFHGTLFEFHRNRVFDANKWELNRVKFAGTNPLCPGAQCPSDRRFHLLNQFGGSSAAQSSRTASSSFSTRRFSA